MNSRLGTRVKDDSDSFTDPSNHNHHNHNHHHDQKQHPYHNKKSPYRPNIKNLAATIHFSFVSLANDPSVALLPSNVALDHLPLSTTNAAAALAAAFFLRRLGSTRASDDWIPGCSGGSQMDPVLKAYLAATLPAWTVGDEKEDSHRGVCGHRKGNDDDDPPNSCSISHSRTHHFMSHPLSHPPPPPPPPPPPLRLPFPPPSSSSSSFFCRPDQCQRCERFRGSKSVVRHGDLRRNQPYSARTAVVRFHVGHTRWFCCTVARFIIFGPQSSLHIAAASSHLYSMPRFPCSSTPSPCKPISAPLQALSPNESVKKRASSRNQPPLNLPLATAVMAYSSEELSEWCCGSCEAFPSTMDLAAELKDLAVLNSAFLMGGGRSAVFALPMHIAAAQRATALTTAGRSWCSADA